MDAEREREGRTVLVLGADGFIGRHIAFGLRARGWRVLAHARNPKSLSAMGFQTLRADLASPQSGAPEFWRERLAAVTHWVNAAGVLTASEAAFAAIHAATPQAICRALPPGTPGVLISAAGIDATETPFARHRRDGEAVALAHGLTVLRAGLVLADTSYGGSSLARALAAMPFATPVVGDGEQAFNPIHADDLAAAIATLLDTPPPPAIHEIGGPETLSQREMLQSMRRWLGLPPVPVLRLPLPLARSLGGLGDLLRLGPISRTAIAQLQGGVLAKSGTLPTQNGSGPQPRAFSQFLMARPAGTQDIWHARLYLLRPLLRLTLAFLWIASGIVGLTIQPDAILPLVPGTSLDETSLLALARFGGILDFAIALALLRNWRPQVTAAAQAALVLGYTAALSALAPMLWLLPLGGLLKNLPILALIAVWAILERER